MAAITQNQITRQAKTESDVSILKTDMSEVKSALTKLATSMEIVGTAIIRLEAARPMSMRDLMGTSIAAASLIGVLVAGLYFLIDARVGTQAAEAIRFSREQQHEGRIYALYRDVERLKAQGWAATTEKKP